MDRAGARWREAAALLGLVLAALLVRAHELERLSLWVDEAFSAWVTTHEPGEIGPLIRAHDTHPPLYYLLLDRWTVWFGDGEAALRWPSVLFAAATVPLVWAAGRTLAPSRATAPWLGALAAAFFALSPFQIAYAQEARSYAALVMATALALLGALRVMREPAARLGWVLLVAGWAGCLWLHNLGALVLASFLPPLAWWAWRHARLGRLLLAVGLAVLIWLPNLPGLLAQLGEVRQGFWLSPPDVPTIGRALEKLLSLERLGSKNPWPLLAALEVWGLVWLERQGRGAAAALLLGVTGLGILIAIVVSHLAVPVFLDRTLIWTALPGYLALAAGLVGLPWRRARAGLAVLVVAAFAWGAASYHVKKSKEPWREVVRVVAQDWQPGDEIAVAPPYGAKAVGYYRRRLGVAGEVLTPRWEDPTEGQERADHERRLREARRVWLVTRSEGGFEPRDYWVTRALAAERPSLRRWSFEDRLGLELYGTATPTGDAP